MRVTLLWLSLFLVAPAGAEVINCGPTVNHRELILRGYDLTFRVDHPFRIFSGKMVEMSGSLLVNPQNAAEGIMVRLESPMSGLYSEDPRLAPILSEMQRGRGKNLQFEFQSRTMELSRNFQGFSGKVKLRLFGELHYSGLKRLVEVPATCDVEDEFFRCHVEMEFGLTDFRLPAPQKAFVWSRNAVKVYGDLTFGPRAEASDAF